MLTVTSETMRQLRALRLWHWRGVLYRRNAQQFYEAKGNATSAQWQEQQANFHMRAVQTLNDFFPMGETAEQDDAAERAAASAHDSPASDDGKPKGRDFIGMNKP